MKYDFGKIEKKWQAYWQKNKIYEPGLSKPRGKGKFYNLMMFPYPSAEGLHVGNMYAFVGADIYGRKKRMEGYDVFQPIGLDGFGIHSENYALKIGAHPMEQAKVSEKRFYKQLESIGNGFAWDEKLETYDPEYYKWTQWIFVQMFKHGLAYRKKAPVNWCPSCKTVLADEQVVAEKCERCGTFVEKKDLEQWFFRITKYAEKLLENLDKIDWSERVKIAQRNWIGRSEGAHIKFDDIEIFTTRPDTIYGATFIVVSGKKDRFTGRYVTNPATKEKIPVWEAEYVMAEVGTGAIMAVPAHDQRDFEFAKKHKLPIKMVICPNYPAKTCPVLDEAYTGEGYLVDSEKFDGMKSEEARAKITKFVGGKSETHYRLRDWLVSRQRYWGPPIPMIYCEKCGWQPVREEDLPVLLPFVKDFQPKGTGVAPLASVKDFYEVDCPKCGGNARRETDVSDTFLDSAWYYLRYPSVGEKKAAWDKEITEKWLPVNLYTGGAEHSVLHLLYVRFLALALHDEKLLEFGKSPAPKGEPFPKFRAHGLLISEGAKMSKSKGNVVNPDEYIKKFGADTLRMYLMFLAPFEQGGDFRDSGILGIERFLQRVWKLEPQDGGVNEKIIHQTIKKVTQDIEALHYNTATSALMILLNSFEEKGAGKKEYEIFLKLLAPFAPHITEELWRKIGNKKSIHSELWPEYDPKLVKEKAFELVIQINGKVRTTMSAEKGLSQNEAETLAKEQVKIREMLSGKKVKKVIYVADRLINFVV